MLNNLSIPYYGVKEAALLHDVVEDCGISLNQIKEIYSEFGFQEYFDKYIEIPLKNDTHDKSVSYEEYINIVMTNPISSLVKMLDLQDNCKAFSLKCFTEKELKRDEKYLHSLFLINKKYQFVEKFDLYRNKKR